MSKKITVSKAIGEALHEEMLRDEKVFIMGEDMAVMGNVFAITKGFLEEFGPNRVIDTPISEEGFVGMAVGAAMRGLRPVVELMYDDFATECAEPLQRRGTFDLILMEQMYPNTFPDYTLAQQPKPILCCAYSLYFPYSSLNFLQSSTVLICEYICSIFFSQ